MPQNALDWGRSHKASAGKVAPAEVRAEVKVDTRIPNENEPFYKEIRAQLEKLDKDYHYRCRRPQPFIDGQTALQFLLEETNCTKYRALFEADSDSDSDSDSDIDIDGDAAHPTARHKYSLEHQLGLTEAELATALGGTDKIEEYLKNYTDKSWHYTGTNWVAEEGTEPDAEGAPAHVESISPSPPSPGGETTNAPGGGGAGGVQVAPQEGTESGGNKYATIEGVVGLTHKELTGIGIDDVTDRRRLVRASETITNWPMHLQMTRAHKEIPPNGPNDPVFVHIRQYNEWVTTYNETKAKRQRGHASATVPKCRELELRRCDLLMEVCMEMLRGLVQASVSHVLDGGEHVVNSYTMETVVRIMSMCQVAFRDDGTFFPAELRLLYIASQPKPSIDVPGFTLSREFCKGLEPAPPGSALLENVADSFKCGDLVEVMKGGREIGAVVIERDREREKERAREREIDIDYLGSYREHRSDDEREADAEEPIVWRRDYTTRHGPMLYDDDDDEPAGGTVCVKFTDVTEGRTECVPASAVYHREEMIRRRVAEKAERCMWACNRFLAAFFDECESSFVTLFVQIIVMAGSVSQICKFMASVLSQQHEINGIIDAATVDDAASLYMARDKSSALCAKLTRLVSCADLLFKDVWDEPTVNSELIIKNQQFAIRLCNIAVATHNKVRTLFNALRAYKDAAVKDAATNGILIDAINAIQVNQSDSDADDDTLSADEEGPNLVEAPVTRP